MCPSCGRSLEIDYDYKKIKKVLTKRLLCKRPFNHARYRELFPVKKLVSIQEGGTHLLESRNIGPRFGIDLWFKLEQLNPTGSFKDRGSSVEIAQALKYGAKNVVCASTGNMGASVSAYSAVANLKCHIFVPKSANHVKIEQILAYGSKVFHVPAGYNNVEALVQRIGARKDFYLLGDYLWRREGTKSIGYEILEQTRANWVFAPVGNGTLVSALWKGTREFNCLELADKTPRIAAVQASGCSPLVKAWKTGSCIERQKNANTVAHAIECEKPIDGERALNAIRQSGGFASQVTDSEILKARDMLAREEGIFAEPSGAVSLAGLLKAKDHIKGRVVCVITGHGLKAPFTAIVTEPVETSLRELEKTFLK
ncbi:MAG: threonine synthase [Candidatus Aenigmatarchaeota archaeon]